MLLKPKHSKFAKAHKGRVSSSFKTTQSLVKGTLALVALQPSRLTAAQISAVDLAIKRALKKDGSVFWRVFPHIPASAKPAEVRMGKGKGSNDFWYTRIQPGAIILEIICPNHNLALLALKASQSKLPFLTFIPSLPLLIAFSTLIEVKRSPEERVIQRISTDKLKLLLIVHYLPM